MVKSLALLSKGVLQKDGLATGNEVKGESNASSRSVKGALSTTLDSKGSKDLQSL